MAFDVVNSLTILYQNIGIITGLVAAIGGGIFNFINHRFGHSKHEAQFGKIIEYLNEAHNFTTQNHDKFVGLVQATTDLNPDLKKTLEAHGADINKVVADSELGKQKLTGILAEINAIQTLIQAKK